MRTTAPYRRIHRALRGRFRFTTLYEEIMKVSISKFYKEVTGKTTVNRGTCTLALARWGVPVDDLGANVKGDAVDIAHLESAKKIHAAEVAERVRVAATVKKTNGSASARGTPPLVSDGDLLQLLVRLDDNVAAISTKLDALIKWHGAKP